MTVEAGASTLSESDQALERFSRDFSFGRFTITSLIAGLFLIPFHELGHVTCDWISGHPAGMSYARDYLLSGGKTPFWGLLGGPLFPLILAGISVVFIYKRSHLSVFYSLAIVGTMDRLVLYLAGNTPSDERELAAALNWPMGSFKCIFFCWELLVLLLVVWSLVRYKAGIRGALLILLIPIASFVAAASFGVFVVDRFLFPEQHRIEFGMARRTSLGATVSIEVMVASAPPDGNSES